MTTCYIVKCVLVPVSTIASIATDSRSHTARGRVFDKVTHRPGCLVDAVVVLLLRKLRNRSIVLHSTQHHPCSLLRTLFRSSSCASCASCSFPSTSSVPYPPAWKRWTGWNSAGQSYTVSCGENSFHNDGVGRFVRMDIFRVMFQFLFEKIIAEAVATFTVFKSDASWEMDVTHYPPGLPPHSPLY